MSSVASIVLESSNCFFFCLYFAKRRFLSLSFLHFVAGADGWKRRRFRAVHEIVRTGRKEIMFEKRATTVRE